jgi:tRNA(Arg) A34 adenosine deaminase TadA
MLDLRAATQHLQSRYLKGAVLYTTLEPCPMCMAAAIWAKCDAVIFGATQEDAIYISEHGTPVVQAIEEFMRPECRELINNK